MNLTTPFFPTNDILIFNLVGVII